MGRITIAPLVRETCIGEVGARKLGWMVTELLFTPGPQQTCGNLLLFLNTGHLQSHVKIDGLWENGNAKEEFKLMLKILYCYVICLYFFTRFSFFLFLNCKIQFNFLIVIFVMVNKMR